MSITHLVKDPSLTGNKKLNIFVDNISALSYTPAPPPSAETITDVIDIGALTSGNVMIATGSGLEVKQSSVQIVGANDTVQMVASNYTNNGFKSVLQSAPLVGDLSFTLPATSGQLALVGGNVLVDNLDVTIPADSVVVGTGTALEVKSSGLVAKVANVSNIIIGNSTTALTTGTDNVIIGDGSATTMTTASDNIAIGRTNIPLCTGSENIAIGGNAGVNLLTGQTNTLIGYNAGSAYMSNESNNICIGNSLSGNTNDNNICRIGGPGISNTYLAGNVDGSRYDIGGVATVSRTGTVVQIGAPTDTQAKLFGAFCTGNATYEICGGLTSVNPSNPVAFWTAYSGNFQKIQLGHPLGPAQNVDIVAGSKYLTGGINAITRSATALTLGDGAITEASTYGRFRNINPTTNRALIMDVIGSVPTIWGFNIASPSFTPVIDVGFPAGGAQNLNIQTSSAYQINGVNVLNATTCKIRETTITGATTAQTATLPERSGEIAVYTVTGALAENQAIVYNGTNFINAKLAVPMAEIAYFEAVGSNTTMTTQNVYYLMTPTTTLTSNNAYFALPQFDTPSGGRLRYIGTEQQHFHVAFSISSSVNNAGDNYAMAIYKNGVLAQLGPYFVDYPANNIRNTLAMHTIVMMMTNDFIEVYVANLSANGRIITSFNYNLQVTACNALYTV